MPVERFQVGGGRAPEEPIDIIVISHNRLDLTVRCLDCIYRNTDMPFHLIVVDDSTDFTPDYIRYLQKEGKDITFAHSDKPYESGNQLYNIGLSHCKHDLAATVNNSIFVEPDWEKVAVQFMRQNPTVGMVGFKCLFPSGVIESAGVAMIDYTPVDLGRDLPGHALATVYEVHATQWAFAMVRVKAAVGNLDEKIWHPFVGWDDLDNCLVLRKKGWQIFYCGMGIGYHEPRATRGKDVRDANTYLKNKQNAETFYKRWGYFEMYKKAMHLPSDYQGITAEDVKDQTPVEVSPPYIVSPRKRGKK